MISVNHLVKNRSNKEEGQKEPYHPNLMFEFNRTDNNVSVEADSKKKNIEEKKNIENCHAIYVKVTLRDLLT